MKVSVIILLLFAMVSCIKEKGDAEALRSEHAMNCVKVSRRLIRCHNDEAVCYSSAQPQKGGVDCRFPKRQ